MYTTIAASEFVSSKIVDVCEQVIIKHYQRAQHISSGKRCMIREEEPVKNFMKRQNC